MCNKHHCHNEDTHLIFGWGTVCAFHAALADRRDVFQLGLDPVLDCLLLELSLELCNSETYDDTCIELEGDDT